MNSTSNSTKTETPSISLVESIIDTKEMVKNPIEVFEMYRKKLGPTFSFYFGGTRRSIVTSDPDFLKHVLKDNNSNYEKSHIQIKRFSEFMGVGVTNSHGSIWLRQRKLLSMGFTHSRLAEILPIQIQVMNDFMQDFDKAVKLGPIDIHEQMIKFTLRSVGKSLFGNQMNEEELEKVAEAIAQIQSFVVKKIIQPYLKPWFIISGQNDLYQKIRVETDQIVKNYVEARRKEGGKESDLLQLLLDTPFKDTGEFMSDETIMVTMLNFLIAGNETTTTAATWVFYQLAKNPEHISKIREEIEIVFGDKPIEYSGLVKLTYTTAVLDEAMRINPPIWMIDREAMGDDEFRGIKIPKGTNIIPYIYGVHHNESVWAEPDKFDPSRFLKEKTNKMHSFAHIPFGGGPRICLGQNMALMEVLLVLCTVIKKYDFELTPNKEIGLRAMMFLKPDGPVNMTFIGIN